MGHAHGLQHAPCGAGLDPGSVDPEFPYPGGLVGVWGYDPARARLLDPAVTADLMGYCEGIWVSDYTYLRLYQRSQTVSLADWQPPPGGAIRYWLIDVDGRSKARFAAEGRQGRPLGGQHVALSGRAADGQPHELVGEYFRHDHLVGGWLLVAPGELELERLEFTLDGVRYVAVR
jgi:hypothetical protein